MAAPPRAGVGSGRTGGRGGSRGPTRRRHGPGEPRPLAPPAPSEAVDGRRRVRTSRRDRREPGPVVGKMLSVQPIHVDHFTDPGCPWAYSAAPALAALRWRFGDQLEWDLVTIGLTEHASQYAD